MAEILIGFMGAGKTSVGIQLAKALNKPFIDLDAEITKQINMPIATYFDQYGEQAFRKIEAATLKEHHHQNVVISTGGGCVETADCLKLLQNHDCVIYLQAGFETLWQRIIQDTTNIRPLAQAKETDTVQALLEKRLSLYEAAASHVIQTDQLSTEEIVSVITDSIDTKKG